MEFSADLNGFNEDSIEPCRTCGIYFTMGMDMDQAIVKPIFGSDDAAVADMAEILEQMNDWNIKVGSSGIVLCVPNLCPKGCEGRRTTAVHVHRLHCRVSPAD